MQAIRETVKTKDKDCHIRLPDWAIGLNLEIIILPAKEQPAVAHGVEETLIHRLLEHPIVLNDFTPMNRDTIYE